MQKVCIFCGEKPDSKTKEHVLPKWLLALTGDPKRAIQLAFPYDKTRTPSRAIAFDQLHFPACDTCNGAFSAAESDAKSIVERLLRHEPLAAADFNAFFDWLDKVRIGLWLGFLYLGKKPVLHRSEISYQHKNRRERSCRIDLSDERQQGRVAFSGR
jgi:hypothetical protein